MPKIPPDQISPFGPGDDGAYSPVTTASPHQRQGDRSAESDDRFLNSRQVRQRYGDASDMWLWRRLNDDSGFPRPLDICGRRFWRLADLVAWERERASREVAAA
jgi:predicted DNA-binding transcriptional regulator AlpA